MELRGRRCFGLFFITVLGIVLIPVLISIYHEKPSASISNSSVQSPSSSPPSLFPSTSKSLIEHAEEEPVNTSDAVERKYTVVEPVPTKFNGNSSGSSSSDSSSTSKADGSQDLFFAHKKEPKKTNTGEIEKEGTALVVDQAASTNQDDACWVEDAIELAEAVENKTCPLIILADDNEDEDAYVFQREVEIRRNITIQGNSLDRPFLRCAKVIRCFRVRAGGYLEMRYVRINPGKGELRDRYVGLESPTPTGQVLEFRGSCIYFDPGATGGIFVSVIFDDDQTDPEEVAIIIDINLNLVSVRIYGGFIFIAGGEIRFIGCLFWDVELLTPNDRIYLGGDLLILAGELSFVGCVWIYTTVFGFENGAGFNIAMLGGLSTYTFCEFAEVNLFVAMNGIGQAFYVAGGVQLLTGVSLTYFNTVILFSGTGEMTVGAGAQIVTGVNVLDMYALLAAFGAGLDYCVGAGLTVHTGASLFEYTGPIYEAMVGGYSFIGTGVYVATGCPTFEISSMTVEIGLGTIIYNGAGITILVGCPIGDFVGISAGFLLGELLFVGAGFLLNLLGPVMEFSGIEVFYGLGGTTFIGAGAAVLGYIPLWESIGLLNRHKDYWVQGICEPFEGSFAPGTPFWVSGFSNGRNGSREACYPLVRDIIRSSRNRSGAASINGSHAGALASSLTLPSNQAREEVDLSEIGLFAFNVTKKKMNFKDVGMVRQAKAIVPSEMVEAAEIMQKSLAPLNLVRGSEEVEGASLYLNSRVDGYCGICGVDSVSGPGLEYCDHEEHCKDFQPPKGIIEDVFNWDTIDFKEHFLVLGGIEMTSAAADQGTETSSSSSLTPALVQKALRHALITSEAKEYQIPDSLMDLQVTVWDAAPDPMFASIFPDPAPSRHLTEMYDTTNRFKFVVVTTAKESSDLIIQALNKKKEGLAANATSKDEEGATAAQEQDFIQLERSMMSFFDSRQDVETGYVGVTYEKFLHVPAYNSDLLKHKDATTNLGSYSIILIDPSQPAVPLNHVEYNKDYMFHLENFPINTLLTIKLIGRKKGMNGDRDVQLKLSNVIMTDDGGRTQVPYRFSNRLTVPPGDYYFKATDVITNLFGISPLLSLTEAKDGRRRKLYGPVWEV